MGGVHITYMCIGETLLHSFKIWLKLVSIRLQSVSNASWVHLHITSIKSNSYPTHALKWLREEEDSFTEERERERRRWLRMISCDKKSHCNQIPLYPSFEAPLATLCSTSQRWKVKPPSRGSTHQSIFIRDKHIISIKWWLKRPMSLIRWKWEYQKNQSKWLSL